MIIIDLYRKLDEFFKGNLDFERDQDGFIRVPKPVHKNSYFHVKLLDDDPVCPNMEIKTEKGSNLLIHFHAIPAIYTALIAYGGEMDKGNAINDGPLGGTGLKLDTVDGFIAHYVHDGKIGKKATKRNTYVLGILAALGLCECNRNKPARLI